MENSSVEQIKQRLTCPVCLDRYKQPKLLPCQHTFCLNPCLVNLVDITTRRIKCPECRMIHTIPIQGVQVYPNNITIMRFLDLDLTKVKNDNVSKPVDPTVCDQCNKRLESISKCLECEKFFCSDCKPFHLTQVKNDTKQNIINLRRMLPQLSQKVGEFEQKKTQVNQNYESIKREISSVIDRLVEELRAREKCLHAEAEVFMESQIRTINLEKENAEIELVSVSSFCDSTEQTLSKVEPVLDNELAIIKNQSSSFMTQANNLQDQSAGVNKISLSITDLNDLADFIKNFGLLKVFNSNRSNQSLRNLSSNSNLLTNGVPNGHAYGNLGNHTEREEHMDSTRNNRVNIMTSLIDQQLQTNRTTNSSNNRRVNGDERAMFGASNPNFPRANPISFTISSTNENNRANNSNHASSTNANRHATQLSTSNTNSTRETNDAIRAPIRSNTFVLEREEVVETNPTRSIDITELYNVRRRARARTPMAFNVMLNEPSSDFQFDSNQETTHSIGEAQSDAPANPRVNYHHKKRAKIIFGKQGKQDGEFIWPADVAVNQFNNQIVIADSNNHRIQIFEADGKFVKNFGRMGNKDAQFECVSGLFIDSMSNIFVVDRLNHRVQIFDRYCRFVRSIGSGQGKGPGNLNYPCGIAVNKISEIFVCDKENDRICVFHLSGRFLRSFGTSGTNKGQFDKPCFIHITRDNKVLVSDGSNHRIQVFDMNGNFLSCFGKEGSKPGELRFPRGITTDLDGFILVSDSGNSRVQVFRPDGVYYSHFGQQGTESGKFRSMEGLTVSQTGDVIVCDKENHRIQII